MDGLTFDSLTRLVGTRRIALTSALGGAAASGIAAIGLGEAEAKKKKRKKCKKCTPLAAGLPCATSKECCTNQTNRACAPAVNDAGGDPTCCGALDAACGGFDAMDAPVAPFCCVGFVCSTIGPNVPSTCQIGPF